MKRDLGRVHALIYIALEPLDDVTVARRLNLTEGDARRHLAELVDWGVVQESPGGRYVTDPDPWVWFLKILAERHHREFGPVRQAMNSTLASFAALDAATVGNREFHKRAERFTAFIEDLSRLIELFLRLGSKPMAAVLKTLAKVVR
jgi:DNA-binding transcriptional regulator GbsR (MarR family)